MILRILKTAVINIEMLMAEKDYTELEQEQILMSLYYMNKGIDNLETVENLNKELHLKLGTMSNNSLRLMNEIRDRDNSSKAPLIKPLYPNDNSGEISQ